MNFPEKYNGTDSQPASYDVRNIQLQGELPGVRVNLYKFGKYVGHGIGDCFADARANAIHMYFAEQDDLRICRELAEEAAMRR